MQCENVVRLADCQEREVLDDIEPTALIAEDDTDLATAPETATTSPVAATPSSLVGQMLPPPRP